MRELRRARQFNLLAGHRVGSAVVPEKYRESGDVIDRVRSGDRMIQRLDQSQHLVGHRPRGDYLPIQPVEPAPMRHRQNARIQARDNSGTDGPDGFVFPDGAVERRCRLGRQTLEELNRAKPSGRLEELIVIRPPAGNSECGRRQPVGLLDLLRDQEVGRQALHRVEQFGAVSFCRTQRPCTAIIISDFL